MSNRSKSLLRLALVAVVIALVAVSALDLKASSSATNLSSGILATAVTRAPGLQPAQGQQPSDPSAQRTVLQTYCFTCHNEQLQTAGLMLDLMDTDHVPGDVEVWEKVIAKLRSGAMPPVGRPRPDDATVGRLVSWLETEIDRAAAARPNPGRPVMHRLNRAEYANAVRDLLAVDVEAASLLPPDDSAFGFDNISDVLTISTALLERYMGAAEKVSRLAIGDPTSVQPIVDTYRVSNTRQEDRASEDLPWGTRGGMSFRRYFPVDGDYTLQINMKYAVGQDSLMGVSHRSVMDVRVDGVSVGEVIFGLDPEADADADITARRLQADIYSRQLEIPDNYEVRFPVTAGTHVVGVAFHSATLEREDLGPRLPTSNYSFQNDRDGPPRIDYLELGGPYDAVLSPESPGRQAVFVCYPADVTDNEAADACAKTILTRLARRAYRRDVPEADVETLLGFYEMGRRERGFDGGIQLALERMLVSPQFLFRAEYDPTDVEASVAYPVSDVELASRLSFFLWSSIPDQELLDLAIDGKLSDAEVLDHQVRRMIDDRRSHALVKNFVGQWLRLRDLQVVKPDPQTFPDFDDELREAFGRETELFFESQLREDRSAVDLLGANYTFLNERLAQHYGIPNVYGSHFRRVELDDDRRVGLLGQASVLTVTSYANRTSPTLRGKWVLENILGAPPPAPPGDVPALEERPGVKYRTMRERLEQHRANPACAACHARIDPMGFALENFDGVGKWRTHQGTTPIDASGALDGVTFNGVSELRTMLLDRDEEFVAALTERLLTYALGRGVDYYDMPAVREIVRQAAQNEYRWSSLIVEVAKSVPFQMRRSES